MSAVIKSATNEYLQTSNLCKQFGEFHALTDVNFNIAEGEFICFLGPSGCGKTTLLRCIAGLETQTSGSIHLAGDEISWRPPSQRDFGIVFQSYALFPNLTVFQKVDPVCVGDGRQAVGDDDDQSVFCRLVQGVDQVGLRFRVEGGRWLIENQNACIPQEPACDGDPLFLPHRQLARHGAEIGPVSVG